MQGKGRAGLDKELSDCVANLATTLPAQWEWQGSVLLRGSIMVETARSFYHHPAQLFTKGHPKKNVTLTQKLRHIPKELPARGLSALTTLLSVEQQVIS